MLSTRSYSQNSPSRIKTLDILATNKLLNDHSYETLIRYCYLARGHQCHYFHDIINFFQQRYQWNILEREEEFRRAWKETQIEHVHDDEIDEDKNRKNQNENNEKKVYISLKKDVFTRTTLLCQIKDSQLQFHGDTGAIGRLTTDDSQHKVTIDLKGRQYSGQLLPGPTIMFLNTTQPTRSSNNSQTILKVEALTNEFCPLVFEKDLLADLMGSYSGEGIETLRSELDEEEDGAISESEMVKKNNTKRSRKSIPTKEGESKKRKRVSKKETPKDSDGESEDKDEKPSKRKSKPKPRTSTSSRNGAKKKISDSEDSSDGAPPDTNSDHDSDSDFSQPNKKALTTKTRNSLGNSVGVRNPKISTQRVRTKDGKKKKSSKSSKK